MVPIFFRFCSNQQFLATKTTIVVFKQHDPQNVTDLSGVAGDPIIAPQHPQTQKNYDFWEFSVENSSPSTILGVEISGNTYFLDLQNIFSIFCRSNFFLSLKLKKLWGEVVQKNLQNLRCSSFWHHCGKFFILLSELRN